MKKNTLLAATSLVLVALVTSCGSSNSSKTESVEESITVTDSAPTSNIGTVSTVSDSGAVSIISDSGTVSTVSDSGTVSTVTESTSTGPSTGGSTSTTEPPELTMKEKFDSIQMYQGGLNQTEFLTKTAQVAAKSKQSKQRMYEEHYAEGLMGPSFGMESDVGYTKLDLVTTCELYGSNEIIDCTEDSETLTSKSETPVVVNGFQQIFANLNTIYKIVDDGTPSYDIPGNYRSVRTKGASEPLANYINFTLSTSNFRALTYLSTSYVVSSGEFDVTVEKLYTVKEGNLTTLHYLSYEEYEAPYTGQSQVFNVYVTFDENNNLVNVGYENEYWYLGLTVFQQGVRYSFGYESNGTFEGELLNPDNYLDLGTIIPEVEEGAYHENVDSYLELLTQAGNGDIGYSAPTTVYEEYFDYEDLSERYMAEEVVITELYDDNVLKIVIQGENMEDEYVYETQVTKDNDNLYEIITNDPQKGDYKIVTPIAEYEGDVDDIFDLRDYEILEALIGMLDECRNGDGSMTCAITAGEVTDGVPSEEGNELVSIIMQGALQQYEDGNNAYLGYLYTIEIGFEIMKDEDGEVTGISLIYSYFEQNGQFDWDMYTLNYQYKEFSYHELGTASNILDPNDFEELPQ